MPTKTSVTEKLKAAKAGTTFLVRFEGIGASAARWEERLPRPVTGAVVLAAVQKKLQRKGMSTYETGDYGGAICYGPTVVARYVIVPGSERPDESGAVAKEGRS